MVHEQPGCEEFRQRNEKIGEWELLHVGFHPEGSPGAPVGISSPHEARALFAVFDEARNVRASLRFVLNLFGEGNMAATGLSIQLASPQPLREVASGGSLVSALAADRLPYFFPSATPITSPGYTHTPTEETVRLIHRELNKVFVANRNL